MACCRDDVFVLYGIYQDSSNEVADGLWGRQGRLFLTYAYVCKKKNIGMEMYLKITWIRGGYTLNRRLGDFLFLPAYA